MDLMTWKKKEILKDRDVWFVSVYHGTYNIYMNYDHSCFLVYQSNVLGDDPFFRHIPDLELAKLMAEDHHATFESFDEENIDDEDADDTGTFSFVD